jgi:hypothetical protein
MMKREVPMFVRKSKAELTAETAALVAKFIKSGGIVKTGNRGKTVKTFRSPFTVFNRGAKKCSLRAAGFRG